jgi:hypothetical protein
MKSGKLYSPFELEDRCEEENGNIDAGICLAFRKETTKKNTCVEITISLCVFKNKQRTFSAALTPEIHIKRKRRFVSRFYLSQQTFYTSDFQNSFICFISNNMSAFAEEKDNSMSCCSERWFDSINNLAPRGGASLITVPSKSPLFSLHICVMIEF